MNKNQFDQEIVRELPHAILFYGESDYYIDYYIEYFIKGLGAKDEKLTIYFDEYNFNQCSSYLSQNSLFGGVNLLILKHDKKIPKKELDILIQLTGKSSNNYLLFGFYGTPTDAKTLQSSFLKSKGADWVRFFAPNINEGTQLLNTKAKNIGLDIDTYALQHLFMLLNGNLALCSIELEKLIIFQSKITTKDIDRLVYSTAPLAVEQLLLMLFEKRPIIEMLHQLLELGEDELQLLRATQRFVYEVFLFNAYIKLYGKPDSEKILGYKLPKGIEESKAQMAMRVKPSSLLMITEFLLERELEMKRTNPMSRETLLYGTFIQMQRYL